MGWEKWTHRRRRVAGLLTRDTVSLCGARYTLPYCGQSTPFSSDYVVSLWAAFVFTRVRELFPGAFVDVGANIGQTLLLIKGFDPKWDYVGFEPNPVSFFVARQLARANAIDSYCLVPVGLSDHSGIAEMKSNFDTDPASTVIPRFRGDAWMKFRSFVSIVVGDDALASIGCKQVGVLKIDVEGGELEVLRGLRGCLRTSRPLVVCEVLALHDVKSVGEFRLERQRTVEQLLVELEYLIFRIEPPRTIRMVPQVPDDRRTDLTDYLFLPKERQAQFTNVMTNSGFELV